MINLMSGLEPQNRFIFEVAAAIAFYYTVYAFLGWVLENSYSFFTNREFFKPNFLKGPFKPMYGIAPVLLVCLIKETMHWAVVIFLCFFIPTLVEYMSGILLEKFFQRKWWDYSNIPMQLQGHICLPFSVCWIFLSFVCLKIIHPMILSLYVSIESYWGWIWPAVTVYFLGELFSAIRRHSTRNYHTGEPTNTVQ